MHEVCPESAFSFVARRSDRVVSNSFLSDAITEWDARDGTLLHRFVVEDSGHREPSPFLASFSVSQDGRLVARTGEVSEIPWLSEFPLEIWDLPKARQVYSVPLGLHWNPVLRVRFSPAGNYILFVYSNKARVTSTGSWISNSSVFVSR